MGRWEDQEGVEESERGPGCGRKGISARLGAKEGRLLLLVALATVTACHCPSLSCRRLPRPPHSLLAPDFANNASRPSRPARTARTSFFECWRYSLFEMVESCNAAPSSSASLTWSRSLFSTCAADWNALRAAARLDAAVRGRLDPAAATRSERCIPASRVRGGAAREVTGRDERVLSDYVAGYFLPARPLLLRFWGMSGEMRGGGIDSSEEATPTATGVGGLAGWTEWMASVAGSRTASLQASQSGERTRRDGLAGRGGNGRLRSPLPPPAAFVRA